MRFSASSAWRREIGDADGLDPVVQGGVQHHAAPATADVEEAHAQLEPQLAADQLVLVGLRLLRRLGRVAEHGARVGQAGYSTIR